MSIPSGAWSTIEQAVAHLQAEGWRLLSSKPTETVLFRPRASQRRLRRLRDLDRYEVIRVRYGERRQVVIETLDGDPSDRSS